MGRLYTLLLIISSLFIVAPTYSQADYQPFHLEQQYVFEYSSFFEPFPSIKYHGVKLEDSCQESYPSLRPIRDSEGLLAGTWFLGEEICIESDFTTLRLVDSFNFKISHHAKEGELWLATDFDNIPMYGIVDSIRERDFLGLTDSVKFIRFGWYDADNTGELYAEHFEPFQISKNYGMITGLVFRDLVGRYFPYYDFDRYSFFQFSRLDLVGLSHPEVGLQNTSIAEVFQSAVGDEFHLISYSYPGYDSTLNDWVFTFFETTHEIAQINFVDSSQTWLYDWTGQELRYKATITGLGGRDSSLNDITGTWKYDLHELAYLDLQPSHIFELNDDFYLVDLAPNQLCSSTGKRISTFYGFSENSCDEPCYFPFPDGGPGPAYLPGLIGGYIRSANLAGPFVRDLVYYHTAQGSCGIPYDFSDIIIDTRETLFDLNIELFPNPGVDKIQILASDLLPKLNLYIFNSHSQLIEQIVLEGRSIELDISHLRPGLYFLRLQSTEGHTISKRFVKL